MMAWDDAPPTKEEIGAKSWDEAPPTAEELGFKGNSERLNSIGDTIKNIPYVGPALSGASNWLSDTTQHSLVGKIVDAPARGVGAAIQALKSGNNIASEYDRLGKQREADQAAYAKAHPYLDTGAQVSSALLLPGSAFSKTAGIAGTVGRAAETAGLAAADAALSGLNPFAAGAGAGGVQAALETVPVVGKVLSKAGDKFSGAAEIKAVKAAMGGGKKFIKDLIKGGKLDETGSSAGRTLLSADEAGPAVIGKFTKPEDAIASIAEKKKFFGKKIEDVGTTLDQVVDNPVDGNAIAAQIRKKAESLAPVSDNMPAINRLQQAAEDYEKAGSMPFSKAQEFKNSHRHSGVEQSASGAMSPKEVSDFLKSTISKEMENATERAIPMMDKTLDPEKELLRKYLEYKKNYGTYAEMAKAGKDRLASNVSNRVMSPSDYFSGGVGAGIGSVIGGVPGVIAGMAAAPAHKFFRERGSAMSAHALDALANMAYANSERLGKFAPVIKKAAADGKSSLGLTHYLLLKNDPEYRNLIANVTDEADGESH